jgi:prepilin-type N-terminal cleavage/methylation domain-containing protein
MKKKAFTLIELVVVMAIIAILSVLIIGAITVARRAAVETSNRGTAKTIQTGLEAYYAKNKVYPGTSGTITFNALVSTGGALNGMVTLQGQSCTTSTTHKDGGYVEYTTTGYILHIATYKCDADLETISNS